MGSRHATGSWRPPRRQPEVWRRRVPIWSARAQPPARPERVPSHRGTGRLARRARGQLRPGGSGIKTRRTRNAAVGSGQIRSGWPPRSPSRSLSGAGRCSWSGPSAGGSRRPWSLASGRDSGPPGPLPHATRAPRSTSDGPRSLPARGRPPGAACPWAGSRGAAWEGPAPGTATAARAPLCRMGCMKMVGGCAECRLRIDMEAFHLTSKLNCGTLTLRGGL